MTTISPLTISRPPRDRPDLEAICWMRRDGLYDNVPLVPHVCVSERILERNRARKRRQQESADDKRWRKVKAFLEEHGGEASITRLCEAGILQRIQQLHVFSAQGLITITREVRMIEQKTGHARKQLMAIVRLVK